MNTTAAQKAGVQAFKDGKGVAPALNTAFLKAAAATGKLMDMMNAYTHGWTVAMLADKAPLDTMPSVRELAAIEAA